MDFFVTLNILLEVSVPLPEALKDIATTTSNQVLKAHFLSMAHKIEAGETLTQVMEKMPLFPQTMISQVHQAEKGDYVPQSCLKISEQCCHDLMLYSSQRQSGVLSLVVFILLALPIGLAMISFYLPMFSVIGAIQG